MDKFSGVKEFLNSYVLMHKITEYKNLVITINNFQKSLKIEKLTNRHGSKNSFEHPFHIVNVKNDMIYLQVNFHIDDDKRLIKRFYYLSSKYDGKKIPLIGGCGFYFKFKAIIDFKKLLSECMREM